VEKVKLSTEEFKDGVLCISEDFDNNGSLDFALQGNLYSPGKLIADT